MTFRHKDADIRQTNWHTSLVVVLVAGLPVVAKSSHAATLQLPTVSWISDYGQLPPAAALYTKGAEYADPKGMACVEEELYLSGNADAVNAADGAVIAASAMPFLFSFRWLK